MTVRLTPRARADRIDSVVGDALKVSVSAPPAENQANEALLRLLAREWRLRRTDLSIVSGAKSRTKIMRIAGDPAALIDRIATALASLPSDDLG